MKTTTGLVVLLDALGSRTSDVAVASRYLDAIKLLQKDIRDSHDDFDVDGTMVNLEPRFFGDSILMTFEIPLESTSFLTALEHVVLVVGCMISVALRQGIPFRGAISAGDYLEESGVALGPAISDAAHWYEQPQLIGVICTPNACNIIKAAYLRMNGTNGTLDDPLSEHDLLMYNVPVKQRGPLSTYILNWTEAVCQVECGHGVISPSQWYYSNITKLNVPPEAEAKYRNTEDFFMSMIASRESRRQQEARTMPRTLPATRGGSPECEG